MREFFDERAFLSPHGLRSLSKKYAPERLEAACLRALAIAGVSLRSVESILKQGLDSLPLPSEREDRDIALVHKNVRGAEYYRERDGRIRLQPANESMQPIYVHEDDITIQGIVVGVLRRY